MAGDLGAVDWMMQLRANSDLGARELEALCRELSGPQPPFERELELHNESTSFSVTSSALAARALRDAVQGWEPDAKKLASYGGVLEQELAQDDPFRLRVVVGRDLNAEERCWVSRSSARVRVPCGRLMVWASHFLPDELSEVLEMGWQPGESYVPERVVVPPGSYRVDLYSYASSVNGFVCLGMQRWKQWWEEVGRAPGARWVDFLLQLRPLEEDDEIRKQTWGGSFAAGDGARDPGDSLRGLPAELEPEPWDAVPPESESLAVRHRRQLSPSGSSAARLAPLAEPSRILGPDGRPFRKD